MYVFYLLNQQFVAKFGLNMKIFILPQSVTNLIKDFEPAKFLQIKKQVSPMGGPT